MRNRMKFKKTTALVLAAVMAVSGGVAALIGSTLTSTPISWTATAPSGAPANENLRVDVAGIKDNKKGELAITASEGFTWGSSNISIASVKANEGETATFLARSPGFFVAYRSTTEGQLGSTNALVYDSTMPYTYEITKNYSQIRGKDKTDTVPITMKDMNNKVITDAVTWTSDDTSVATVEEKTGVITAVAEGGVANIIGKFTDCYGQAISIHYTVVVGKLTENEILGPDDDGKYWKPVGNPENIWEEVDENGNSIEPENYVYDENDPLTGDDDIPAVKGGDGGFYLENPKNIFTPVKPDGSLDEENKIWGGDDFKPGTTDDEDVDNFGTKENPDYWVNYGENVYAKVSSTNGKIGAMTGAGLDEDPTTDGVKPIFDNREIDNHFYYGPHTDADGISYYIGDDWQDGGNGDGLLNTEDKNAPHPTDTIYYRNEDGTMTKEKPVTDIPATSLQIQGLEDNKIVVGDKEAAPTVVILPNDATNQTIIWSTSDSAIVAVDAETGEVTGVAEGTATITATVKNADNSEVTTSYTLTVVANTGDWSDVTGEVGEEFSASGWDWIIIGKDGNGNALVTTKYLIGAHRFAASSNVYANSELRTEIEKFYSTDLVGKDNDLVVAGDKTTKRITAVAQPSNFINNTPAYDAAGGLSAVSENGNKTCFALSYQEANKYLKGKSYVQAGYNGNVTASGLSKGECGSVDKDTSRHAQCTWLRSPGYASGAATYVGCSGDIYDYSYYVNSGGFGVRPALWIKLP
ncbi:Ig-like domain-containing protein [Ohessyouella blattaphilus]|uniref:Ig-like domain-containing protein n=1 Tax=Ohessyouella blattaphilus TaxID=2949333 RepID=UPI003EBFA9CB